jgi:hypothetical protein
VQSIRRLRLLRDSLDATVWIGHDPRDWDLYQRAHAYEQASRPVMSKANVTAPLRRLISMSILVEYRCQECTGRQEQWVDGAVPPTTVCRACGGSSVRRLGGTLLGARSAGPEQESESARRTGDPCRDFPDVPRVCHMAPSVARRWAAQVCGDNRALERQYQETAVKSGALDPANPFPGDQGSIASAASATAAVLGTA